MAMAPSSTHWRMSSQSLSRGSAASTSEVNAPTISATLSSRPAPSQMTARLGADCGDPEVDGVRLERRGLGRAARHVTGEEGTRSRACRAARPRRPGSRPPRLPPRPAPPASAATSWLRRSSSSGSRRVAAKNRARGDSSPSSSMARMHRCIRGRSSTSQATVSPQSWACSRASGSRRCAAASSSRTAQSRRRARSSGPQWEASAASSASASRSGSSSRSARSRASIANGRARTGSLA